MKNCCIVKLSEKKKSNERGSVILFVLIAILFFIIIVFNIYNNLASKINVQEKQTQKIQEEYAKKANAESLEQIYNELIERNQTMGPTVRVSSNSTFAKSQTAVIVLEDSNSGLSAGSYIVKYTWTTSSEEPVWRDITTTIPITVVNGEKMKTATLTKSDGTGTYYLHIQVENLNNLKGDTVTLSTYGIFNFDNILPTVAMSPDGGTYYKPNDNNAMITITLSATDTGGSGLNLLQYAWSNSNTTEPTSWNTFTNEVPFTRSIPAGKHYLWTKVTDKAGNCAISVKTSKIFTVGGWQVENGDWYYYSPDTGDKLNGWVYTWNDIVLQNAKHWYYFNPNNGGKMHTGWLLVDGYYYYLSPLGGNMTTGWIQLEGVLYYLKPAGFTGWSGPEGSMLKNTTVTINGKSYTFGSSGACTNP